MDILKHRQFLLSEIKVNKPKNALRIIPLEDKPRIFYAIDNKGNPITRLTPSKTDLYHDKYLTGYFTNTNDDGDVFLIDAGKNLVNFCEKTKYLIDIGIILL